MLQNSENNVTEEFGLVTPTREQNPTGSIMRNMNYHYDMMGSTIRNPQVFVLQVQ